jgi:hypothetical protein
VDIFQQIGLADRVGVLMALLPGGTWLIQSPSKDSTSFFYGPSSQEHAWPANRTEEEMSDFFTQA